MNTLFLFLSCIFIGCIISIIIIIMMKYLDIDINSKYAILLSGFILGIVFFVSAMHSDVRDKKIYNIIFNSNSVEDIQEKTHIYFED